MSIPAGNPGKAAASSSGVSGGSISDCYATGLVNNAETEAAAAAAAEGAADGSAVSSGDGAGTGSGSGTGSGASSGAGSGTGSGEAATSENVGAFVARPGALTFANDIYYAIANGDMGPVAGAENEDVTAFDKDVATLDAFLRTEQGAVPYDTTLARHYSAAGSGGSGAGAGANRDARYPFKTIYELDAELAAEIDEAAAYAQASADDADGAGGSGASSGAAGTGQSAAGGASGTAGAATSSAGATSGSTTTPVAGQAADDEAAEMAEGEFQAHLTSHYGDWPLLETEVVNDPDATPAGGDDDEPAYAVALNQEGPYVVGQEGVVATLRRTLAATTIDYTDNATWSVTNPSVLSIDSGGNITFLAAGTATVQANVGGVDVASASLTVEADSDTWITTVISADEEPFEYGNVVQLSISDGARTISTADYGWAFEIVATEGEIVFNNNNEGIRLLTPGTITLRIKLAKDVYNVADSGPESTVTISVVDEDGGIEGDHVVIHHKAKAPDGNPIYYLEPLYGDAHPTPWEYDVTVAPSDGATIGGSEWIATSTSTGTYEGRHMIPVTFTKNGSYTVTMKGKSGTDYQDMELTRTIEVTDASN